MNECKKTDSFCPRDFYLPFNRVQFVSEGKNVHDAASNQQHKSKHVQSNKVDGVEIREFYNKLITEPPSTQQCCKYNLRKIDKSISKQYTPPKPKIEKLCNDDDLKNLKKNVHRFAQDGNISEVQKCVESGIDLNLKDSFGWTPLMCAVSAGHVNVVKFLLEHNVNIEIQTPQGLTAYDIAKKQNSSAEIQNILINPSQIKELSKKSIEVRSLKKKAKFHCHVCKKEFEDSIDCHERSIAHLLMLNRHSKNDKTFYHIPQNNKGCQIMVRKGWDANSGLGPNSDGRKYPIKTILKTDRSCIGKNKKEKERITHFGPNDVSAIHTGIGKKLKTVAIERERTLKKREREKLERKNRQKEIAYRRAFDVDL